MIVIGSTLRPEKPIIESTDNLEKKLSDNTNRKPEDLSAQYRELEENQRFLLRLLWEIPAIAIAISSAFLVAAYNFFPSSSTIANLTDNAMIRGLLLAFGSLLMFVAFLAVVKHRHFRGVWLVN